MPRIQLRRQRFDTLALCRQHQARAVLFHRAYPINMPQDFGQLLQVVIKVIRLHPAYPREDI
jgi:hypothetical protein